MQSTFEVVAEPTRRRILDLLLERERPVGDLATALEMSQPAVSRHLRVLRDAGLVAARTDAQRRVYRLDPEPLAALDEWLRPYRRMWAASLDRLALHLDEMDDEERISDA
jgi:DNA-binding transcriptional ArsR family regulator